MRGVLGGRVQRGRHAHQKLALFNKKPLRMHSQAVRHTPSLTPWFVQVVYGLKIMSLQFLLEFTLKKTGIKN